jgi:hypothetical protein
VHIGWHASTLGDCCYPRLPAVLLVVQSIGQISEAVISDIESKVRALRAEGHKTFYCIIVGQDTARLLRGIAVGTGITPRPPHRSERAQFGHSAPTLGA